MVEITGDDGITYSFGLDQRLKKFLDEKVIAKINKKDKDYVMLVDGYEGAGKSVWSMQVGKYVDPNLSLDRICFTAREFREAVYNANKGQCVIYDEAVTGMAAGESITKVGKLLKSLMMQMRQKNLFVIIVLPSIFELNKYAVLSRAMSFFHIYEKKERHAWVGYNKKDTRGIYLLGKKTHSYRIKSRFIGRFYGKYTVDELKYRAKKEQALKLIDEEDEGENKYIIQRDFFIRKLKDFVKTNQDVWELQKNAKYPISVSQIGKIMCKKM